MIKASEGGGGYGIRISESADDFANLFRQVTLIRDPNYDYVLADRFLNLT
jgi:biotin carboxylase